LRSIRFFLIASILATLTLFNFIAALQGYRSSMDEAESLFDRQLENIAQLVLTLDDDKRVLNLELQNDIIFQYWRNNKLVLASGNSPQEKITNFDHGYDFANFSGYRWRTYAHEVADGNSWVLVAERSDLRFTLAESVVLESILPILLGIPLAGLIIWITVSLGLRPLELLSTELKNKKAQDLTPLRYESPSKELEPVVSSINGFINRLESLLEREKRFSADAAHELRTPISALKIHLHNLQSEIKTDTESFQEMQAGVERMEHLIEQLLSLSRSTPENFMENCRQLDLYEMAQSEIARLYGQFENRNQSIELRGSRLTVSGDAFAVETLLDNLLTNANKYAPDGGKIIVGVYEKENTVTLSVEDNGPGIAHEDQSRIFDRFYRSETGTDGASPPGCGLGLTIVTQIAEMHGARLQVSRSRFETGSAFQVVFRKG